ncbi:MAG: sugar transferase [Candidatus Solibacter sp.]|nr:sugar transferase [Candidatus Solibacter sp.]
MELVCPGLRDPGARLLKRILDVMVAALLLILALPLAAAIALASVLEKRGPVFFAQTRIGKGRRRFRLWKFRSMVVDADAMLARHLEAHPDNLAEWREMHKLKDDPRVTRVGRLLRRCRLDELPQLINVLRGEMSMVGPRPIVEEEITKYGPVFSLYVQVLPGLTGLWQVSGHTNTSYRERTELDMRYMRSRTIWMDLVILLKTVRVVLFGRGAY